MHVPDETHKIKTLRTVVRFDLQLSMFTFLQLFCFQLSSCFHVLVRNVAAKTTLDRANTGPYRVLKRTDKYFTLEMRANRYDNVTINRLKACSVLMRVRDPLPELPGPFKNDVQDNDCSDLLPPHSILVIAPEIVGTPVSSQLEVGSPSLPLDKQHRTRYGRSHDFQCGTDGLFPITSALPVGLRPDHPQCNKVVIFLFFFADGCLGGVYFFAGSLGGSCLAGDRPAPFSPAQAI